MFRRRRRGFGSKVYYLLGLIVVILALSLLASEPSMAGFRSPLQFSPPALPVPGPTSPPTSDQPGPYCSLALDCFAQPQGNCPGSHACVDNSCVWQCDGNLSVHFIDVNQGDSVLVELDGSPVVLIDAGNNGFGDSTVVPYMQSLGFSSLPAVLGSHNDADHIGGVDEVISEFKPLAYYSNKQSCSTRTCTEVLSALNDNTVQYLSISRGQELELGGLTFKALNPVSPLEFSSKNNNSIVLLLEYGSVSFLFTGDCEEECEESILSAGLGVDVNVLKVGHHGSSTSTTQNFFDAVSPQVAVISLGANNQYGHPHKETLEKLAAGGVQVLRTDLNGNVVLKTDGNSLFVGG